jgi:RNA polymerase sigma factor (sigma-70 family)
VASLVTRNNGTADDAEDILQEAIVTLWERVRTGRFEYSARLSTFLYATARNLWMRRLARARREPAANGANSEMGSGDPDPLELMVEGEEATIVGNALERLGEPCKKLLVLFYWEERTMEEIAAALGFVNADSAKSKKYQCKKALEKLLRDALPHYD